MSKQIVPSLSFSPADDSYKEDIHAVAERFLRDHLAKTGSKCEAVRPVVPRATCAVESRSAAEGFLRQHLAARQVETKRYEVEAPQKVILAQRSVRSTTFFYGWHHDAAIFTHAQHLAQVIDSKDATKLQESLKQTGIETFVMPAPEIRRGSL